MGLSDRGGVSEASVIGRDGLARCVSRELAAKGLRQAAGLGHLRQARDGRLPAVTSRGGEVHDGTHRL
jgi:hypothetical protein